MVLAATDVGQEADAATTTIEGIKGEGTKIVWEFEDSKGNEYRWSMPITTYENIVVESRDLVRPRVEVTLDGEPYGRVPVFDGFVKRSFTNVVDSIYDNSYGDSDFVWEVWYIVSQLTVYDKDIHEYSEGRYALETLSRGGGDCEDLVILIADMLMSSEHTDDWTIQYVLMDSKNPTDLQEMNHAILKVDNGDFLYFIEATGSPRWDWYDRVVGWFFDVVPYTDTPDYSGLYLSGYDLSNKDLSYTTFVDADLSEAWMFGAYMEGADLSYADLTGAFLSGALLSNALLYDADLTNAHISDAFLDGADMSYADLSGAFLTGAYMTGADMSYADLSGATLDSATLSDANLSLANLSNAFMVGAFLDNANLSYADLTGADLRGADLSYADLTGADLRGADLRGAYLSGALMDGADLTGADLTDPSLADDLALTSVGLDVLIDVVDSMIAEAEATSEPPRLDDLYLLMDALSALSEMVAALSP